MSTQLKPAVTDDDHSQGSSNAVIELVEYGDYQCSYCGQAYSIIKGVQQSLGNHLKFVFRNFPLTEAHPNAYNAALAAEAAALQNKFWEMHDVLYENQAGLETHHLLTYAKNIGLDIERFKADLQNEKVSAKVDSDFESGVRSGVNGTPSFYVNGKKYDGDWAEEELTAYMKGQL